MRDLDFSTALFKFCNSFTSELFLILLSKLCYNFHLKKNHLFSINYKILFNVTRKGMYLKHFEYQSVKKEKRGIHEFIGHVEPLLNALHIFSFTT